MIGMLFFLLEYTEEKKIKQHATSPKEKKRRVKKHTEKKKGKKMINTQRFFCFCFLVKEKLQNKYFFVILFYAVFIFCL